MSQYPSSDWHSANGGGLAFRPPPSVDEAIMYSPFVSIVPFSPDVIPFPSAEPPTPPSTLTPDQQTAARRAVGILNNEIKSQTTAQHLDDTLRQLQALLHRDKLPEYNFKTMQHFATPPPDSPVKDLNGDTPSNVPALSPFASMLLKHTNVSYAPHGTKTIDRSQKPLTPPRQAAPPPQVRTISQPKVETPKGYANTQNAQPPPSSSALSSAPQSTPIRSGPTVVAKPISGRREEYVRYDTISTPDTVLPKKKEDKRSDGGAAALKPHEREIVDRKTEELRSLVEKLLEDKQDPDGPDNFESVSTDEGDVYVMIPKAMVSLSDKMSSLINLGRFAALPVELVLNVQSLLQPGITSTTKNASFERPDETSEWSQSVSAAELALKASKMVLDTMIEGRDDYRMRREEIIDMIIDLIKFIKDACIVPIVQARRSGPTEVLFSAATGQRRELQAVLRLCGSVFSRFAVLLGKHNLSERALNSLEYLTLELVMEPNSDSEKDSVFTVQKFEQFRQKAVDVLAEIFARHIEQQSSILNGILSNLEKLPDKKASARQFKSAREVPIMTISALFMRFVQVAAANKTMPAKKGISKGTEEGSSEEESDNELGAAMKNKKRGRSDKTQLAQSLFAKAMQIAATIVTSLIERASNVSKTGDKPFRNLLDLFIEDFCNVLGSPEWPAAEMLLQQILVRMQNILQADLTAKQSVVDKDMALSTMSRIGCGALDLKIRLKKLKREKLDVSLSGLSSQLDRLLDEALNDDAREGINDMDLLAFDGPYRMVVESLPDYMDSLSSHDDPRLQSVSGCHVTLWMNAVNRAFPASAEDTDTYPLAVKNIRKHLESITMDSRWLAREHKFPTVSEVQSKLAAGIVTLQTPVCKHVKHIVTKMLERMQDKSSKLRSRGMSGLEQLIQKDPRVIQEGHVKNMVTNFNDPSPMVRESTLSLVSTCLEHQPSLQPHFLPYILRLTTDPSNGPKKKAIKLLRDVYNGHCSKEDKLNIIASLLQPSQDDEKAIAELAGNILEEILLATTKYNANSNETQLKLRRAKRSTLIIETIQHIRSEPRYLEAFEKLFIHVLSPEAKTLDANSAVCKDLVADMIDEVISSESGDANFQARIMIALSIFAKVRPTLFTVDQIQLLKLYIKDIATTEDLALVQPTVVVFRYVFATLSSLQAAFAEEVRAGLMRIISKLASWAAQGRTEARDTLIDIAHCLWTITPMVEQGASKLCTSIISILCQLRPLAFCTKEQAFSKRGKITPYIILLGTFGKVCNFDQHIEVFRERLALTARSTVDKKLATPQQMEPYLMSNSTAALLLLEAVRPFTMQTWDMSIRAQALQSVGGICQGSPNLFMRAEIEKIFKLVFINTDNDQLRRIALVAFNEYFNFAERRSDTGAEIAVGKGAATGNARLETSFIANENDSATLHIAQRFLQNFVDTALKHNNVLAHLATNIVASISRQGLVHPKECGAALVALCTSPNEAIAQVAAVEHKRIHEKQESYLEKEYMQAIRMAFKYQSEVFNDPHGMRQVTHSAKLARLFEALKSGKKATFKKFINNMCKQIDFNFAKLDATGDTPEPVLFARFCLENLALLDFSHLEELALCLNALEAIVLKTTGPIVALAIETEMPKRFVAMEQHPGPDMHQHPLGDAAVVETPPVSSQLAQPNISDARLREITAACMILKMVWETRIFVRRCFNMQKLKGRIPQKDYIKPAQRNNFVSGKELWETLAPIMNALDTRDAMLRACYEFADILEVDREAEIEEGEDSAVGTGYETPTEGDDSVPFPTSGRGRKRKSNVSLSNTPKKQRGRPAGARKKRNSKTPDFDDDED